MTRTDRTDSFTRRARLSLREIALAVALTLAAVAFVLLALQARSPETAQIINSTSAPN